MAVPFTFATASGNIALSKLDSNFSTPITIGNTSVLLGNTITTLNNMTLANVTITSGTSVVTNVSVSNIVVTNLTATLANITTSNVTNSYIASSNIANATITNATITNLSLPSSLTVPNGGTGRVTLPVSSVLLGNGTGSFTSVDPGTTGNVLVSKSGAWVSNAFSTGFTAIVYSNATGVLSNVAIGTGLSFSTTTGVLVATGAVANAVTSVGNTYPILSTGGTTPTISFVDPGTTGNVLTSVGGVWVSNATASGGGGVTTFSGGSTGLLPANATPGAITLTGTLAVANGGTGVTASTGANSVVIRSSSNNITANAYFNGFTSVAASGTLITLTIASTPIYFVTGSGGQIIKLPDATTLSTGTIFLFNNNQSSGAITVNNNSNTLVVSVPVGGYTTVVLTSNATAAGSWDRHDQTPSNVSWSTNTLDYAGSITSATWNGVAITVPRGGTGLATIPAGNVVIGNGTSALYGIAPGTTGNVLTSIGGNWVSNAVVSSAGTSPGGSTTQVQFNNAGSFGGDANLTFSGSTLTAANLTVSNLTASQAVFSSSTKQLVSNPITGTSSVVMNTSPIITTASLINPTVTNYIETLYSANTGTAITIDLANGTVQNLTLTGNATITMPTAVAGKSFIIILSQDATGSRTVTWTTVVWPSATAPTITSTASKKDIYSFFSNGTSWYGTTIGQNY